MPGKKSKAEVSESTEEVEDLRVEIFNGRWDRTDELLEGGTNKWKRRLDSITRLIEGGTTCAAIAIQNKTFLIATNKEFPSDLNTSDQGYLLIDKVMSYLRELARGNIAKRTAKAKARAEIFTEICIGTIVGLQLPVFKRDKFSKKNNNKSLVEIVLKLNGSVEGICEYLAENRDAGKSPGDEGSVFLTAIARLKDLDKVIDFILRNRKKADVSPTANFMSALKSYEPENIITKSKLSEIVTKPEMMHAEMRVVALLREKLENKEKFDVYIGISKLCCIDCHMMIHAVNTLNSNYIEIRGAHNIEHSKNWSPPFNMSGTPFRDTLTAPSLTISGKNRQGRSAPTVKQSFPAAIVAACKHIRSTHKLSAEGIWESVADSQTSSPESPNSQKSSSPEKEEDLLILPFSLSAEKKKIQDSLDNAKTVFSSAIVPGALVDENLRFIQLGLEILKSVDFEEILENLHQVEQLTIKKLIDNIERCQEFLNSTLMYEKLYTKQEVLLFLQAEQYVGKKVAKHFLEDGKELLEKIRVEITLSSLTTFSEAKTGQEARASSSSAAGTRKRSIVPEAQQSAEFLHGFAIHTSKEPSDTSEKGGLLRKKAKIEST